MAELILSMDTATPCSTVAITEGDLQSGRVVGEVSLSSSVTHSRRLLTAIDWLIREASISKDDISGYGVGLGPGSFTGLRIGMATAKGLAAASGKPLFGVSSLDIIAASCPPGRTPLCALLDARKKELYVAFYRFDENGGVVRMSEPEALAPETLIQRIKEPTLMVGDGLRSYGDYLVSEMADNCIIAPSHLWSPSAGVLGLIAGSMAARGESDDAATVAPLYVRASDAELNLKKKS